MCQFLEYSSIFKKKIVKNIKGKIQRELGTMERIFVLDRRVKLVKIREKDKKTTKKEALNKKTGD